MRGKEGPRPTTPIVMQVLDYRARDGQSIVSTGAASDLIENYQAAGCCMVQNIGRLHHLDHKGTLARCQVVLSPNAREDAVYDANRGRLSGDIAANLGHQGDERHLTQIGGFSGHVWPSDDEDLSLVIR